MSNIPTFPNRPAVAIRYTDENCMPVQPAAGSLQSRIRFKYLQYIPKPVLLHKSQYDLVDDATFCTSDERLPLLMATQFGLYPAARMFGNNPDYYSLQNLQFQWVALRGRGYLSEREHKTIRLLYVTKDLILQLKSRQFKADWPWLCTLPILQIDEYPGE